MEETKKKSFIEIMKAPRTKKILTIVLNTILWLFVAFSLLITILVFSAQGSRDGVPSIFGKSLITISTDSMKDTYDAGDLVFLTKLSEEEIEELDVGDIITFRSPEDINGDGIIGNDLNTHRIVQVIEPQNPAEHKTFKTKGDFNPHEDDYIVDNADIIGVCTEDGKLSGVGNVISFLRSSLGFFLFIVLPLILFFLYELYHFITILVTEKAKKAAATGITPESEEEIKKRAVEEYLAKQKNEEEIKRRAIEEYLAAQKAEENNEDKTEDKTEDNNEDNNEDENK